EEQLEHRELLARLGYEPGVELLGQEYLDLGSPLTETMDAPAGTRAIRASKRWTADGRPAMLADNVLILPEGSPEQIDAGRSIFELIEELWHEPVLWEVATPGVENIDALHGELLGLSAGDACMTLAIVGMLRSGRRVFHAFER